MECYNLVVLSTMQKMAGRWDKASQFDDAQTLKWIQPRHLQGCQENSSLRPRTRLPIILLVLQFGLPSGIRGHIHTEEGPKQ
jgi:hypothetical protein